MERQYLAGSLGGALSLTLSVTGSYQRMVHVRRIENINERGILVSNYKASIWLYAGTSVNLAVLERVKI